MIWPLFKYVMMAAIRDRLLLSIAGILVIVSSLCIFFGASVITEQDQFTQTFAAYGLRLFGALTISIFVVSHIRRSFENRDVEYLLSRPMGRAQFVLTYAAAFSCLAIIAALALSAGVAAFGMSGNHMGLALWVAGLCVELVIMSSVSMFFALVVTSQTVCVLSVFAFYLLARLMGDILGILQHNAVSGATKILAKIMELVSIVIPRLDMLGQSEWILYGVTLNHTLMLIFGQCAAFFCLVICAAVVDIYRRQF